MPTPLTMPLFPLSTVLYPGGVLHLQIFEVRYLDLMRRCLREGTPFGVVSLLDGAEVRNPLERVNLAGIGTLAEIKHCEAISPTLLKIHAVGTQRFKLNAYEQQKAGLWVGEIETLDEEQTVQVPEHLQTSADTLDHVIKSIEEQGRSPDELPFKPPYLLNDCGWVSNRWCEILPLEKSTRLQLLGLDNPLLRLELVNDILVEKGISSGIN
ncbi:MAG: LON peptidase substrate-binding domain-containing protein [Limnobacter sp.]|nr:LON peptidase substrate-binding domain-containing protein [Limnobacter sp.]